MAKGDGDGRFRAAEARLWASFGLTATERRLRLERTGVTVRVQEVGDGPPALFVHGAMTSGVSWAGLVAGLTGLRCILLDRPGCGLSEPLPVGHAAGPAGLARYGDALVADVLDALELDRAHLVGTSFGGYHVLRTAAAHPDRVDRVAALGWSFGAPARALPLMMRASSLPALGRLGAAMPLRRSMIRPMLKRIGLRQAVEAGKIDDHFVGAFFAMLRDTPTRRNELEATPRVITMKGVNPDVLLGDDVLRSIAAPVLFLWGDGDPFGGADVAEAFTRRVPHATLEVLEGAGHAPWVDEPERCAAAITAFLQLDPASERRK